jgi:hypothetical protein
MILPIPALGFNGMIRDLDATIRQLLTASAPSGSTLAGATISFDLPDAEWRSTLSGLTVNCYLYDIHENLEMRTHEPLLVRSGQLAARVTPPARIDCAYCITAWSPATTDAVLEEHDLLSQVLLVLLQNPTIPAALLQGSLVGQIPPYPTVIASVDGIVKNHPQFWTALDQKLKPSLNYIVTLAMLINGVPAGGPTPYASVVITAGQQGLPPPPQPAPEPPSATVFTILEK